MKTYKQSKLDIVANTIVFNNQKEIKMSLNPKRVN